MNQPTFVKPINISVWRCAPWIEGRRPATIPLVRAQLPGHGPTNVWHMAVEINGDRWSWSPPFDEGISLDTGFTISVKVPDLSGRGMPTELERFLDQEIGI